LDTSNFSRAVPKPFGAANWITAIRALFAASLLCYLAGILALGLVPNGALRWAWVAAALVALALDGIDGALARRLGQVSTFGARFDMETDAATLFGLAWLVWASGQAGPWVLASGLMRYIFILASRVWPALAAPLPPKKRRQAVCVVQVAVLILAAVPVMLHAIAASLCLAGLALLGYSFAVDVVWLMQHDGQSEEVVI
jgi:phosphatidylglycerophosphate synthase